MSFTIVNWKSSEEVDALKYWFFSDDRNLQQKAVNTVKTFMVRGKLLHSIEMTCLLTAVVLQDEKKKESTTLQLRMSYSFALIKFVNGLLDPYQKSTHAIPLHSIARKVDLPSCFVEIRHISTHETLPSLNVLQKLTKDALLWLKNHFWEANDFTKSQEKSKFAVKSNAGQITETDEKQFYSQLKDHLRGYRKFHKYGVRVVVRKTDEKDEEILKYWENLDSIKEFIRNSNNLNNDKIIEILLNTLVFNNVLIMTKKDIKFSQLRNLYTPLIEFLTIEFEKLKKTNFHKLLFEYILVKQIEYYESEAKATFSFKNENEINLSTEWLEHLISPKYSKSLLESNDVMNSLTNQYSKNEQVLKLFEKLKEKKTSSKHFSDLKWIDNFDLQEKSSKRPNDEDDGGVNKRPKSLFTKNLSQSNNWEPIQFYQPTPFGVPL